MDMNVQAKPRMPSIENFADTGPVGVLNPCCTMDGDPTPALTGRRRTRPTSPGCRNPWQPKPGRAPLIAAQAAVQTNRATSVALSRAVPAPIGLSTFQQNALLAGGATLAQISQLNASIAGLTAVSLLAPSGRITGDDIGVGYTLGATLKPWAGTEIGVGFRSSMHHELEGKITPALGIVEPVRAPVNLPEIVTVGLSQQVGAQWKILAGYEWAKLEPDQGHSDR